MTRESSKGEMKRNASSVKEEASLNRCIPVTSAGPQSPRRKKLMNMNLYISRFGHGAQSAWLAVQKRRPT